MLLSILSCGQPCYLCWSALRPGLLDAELWLRGSAPKRRRRIRPRAHQPGRTPGLPPIRFWAATDQGG
jgi:hypothetical protein